ncbi:phosphoribosyl-ATP diphosphatase [Sandaracinobacteroides saxicola]|uniref:Phosphoribosyl-ATP pyrophosphatase n=1 Tax=Sandaracinobacteroides saxicola TaxID=2759707 RepID=A0A7G5IFE7_9SPHN|nr:phosphoribosyl-ATP diphosphatase [Sandaracinobacteroides saxicola]QMW22089.1 phosphoribosyl-ATP diphosphatase [Sandaracinobacteroides saxicola]
MTDLGPLARLDDTIRARRTADPATSYVARLLHEGRAKIAKKLGEEATETVIAALSENDTALTAEAADLLFHLLLVLAERDIPLASVMAELARREGTSGLTEKAARPNALPRRDTP